MSFNNYHLSICRDEFDKRSGILVSNDNALSIKEIAPFYKTWRNLVDRVGSPWGWDRRPAYHEKNGEHIKQRLMSEESRLFVLQKFDRTIGFCWAYQTSQEEALGYGSREKAAKIETFGLFEEETGKGHGRYFLPLILKELFNDASLVFLETRSTNHKKVVSFYTSLGMEISGKQENLPDDLVL